MGCGSSKLVTPDPNAAFKGREQFNIRKALSVGELLEQAEALNGKRVLVVGRAKNAGQVLQTPFGERNALAAEVVGYTNNNKVEADTDIGRIQRLRVEQCVSFAVVDGDKRIEVTAPEERPSEKVLLWVRAINKQTSIRWDKNNSVVHVGGEWQEEQDEGADISKAQTLPDDAFMALGGPQPIAMGRFVKQGAPFWRAYVQPMPNTYGHGKAQAVSENAIDLEAPENFNWRAAAGRYFKVMRRIVNEMALVEGDVVAVVGEVRYADGKLELHAGHREALLISNNKQCQKAVDSLAAKPAELASSDDSPKVLWMAPEEK